MQVAVIKNYSLSGTEVGRQARLHLLVNLKELVAIRVYDHLHEVTLSEIKSVTKL
jgi:hypothetical protein